MRMLFATTNLHKLRELKQMCMHLTHIDFLSLHQFNSYVAPEETGATFKENAILKACHAAKKFNCWALADDSGLVVPALNGAPGIYSARYAGEPANDQQNCLKLICEMQDLDGESRSAYYHCCLALVSPDQQYIKTFEGNCEGYIAQQPSGSQGFGYDPLFVKNGYEKTFAELDESIKNRVSHRHKAIERLLIALESSKF